MDFDDESEEEVETDEGDLGIKYSSKKSAVWRLFVMTKRRNPKKKYLFARCRLCIKLAFPKSTFIGVLNTTNIRNCLIRKQKNEFIVEIASGQKVNAVNNVCVI
jgi:hypothetical protein